MSPALGANRATGERLHHLFEEVCDELVAAGAGDRRAVDAGEASMSYAELDARANQLARYLAGRGVRAGARVGLLFDHGPPGYIAMLAVLKLHAAYVPLDPGFPPDRLAYITSDARVGAVLTHSHLRGCLRDCAAEPIALDEVEGKIRAERDDRLSEVERPGRDDPDGLCYAIYTSGSTGRPKGVAVAHPSICNFVRVAAREYGIRGGDRVYQGMTLAFDFSVEETWVPLRAGATLVPKPPGGSLVGEELAGFLAQRHVTALCCVPTLLATIDDDLPELRFLLVSGEACPQDLVARWHRPSRRFLNVYGPTEATVTCAWAQVQPDRPVTLGQPLPTYSIVLLEPRSAALVADGEPGEIGIAGVGLAIGYLNREDLTERAFVPDFVGLPDNPSGRIYRSGDLGRLTERGEIEYLGRIDQQVKIRGYRIELTEIESVLLQVPGIAAAVVDTYRPAADEVELVAYYSLRPGVVRLDPAVVRGHLRDRLPAYMVPAYFEQLAVIPMLPSDKADRKALPPPSGPRAAGTGEHVASETAIEGLLAGKLAGALRMPRVSATAHFFDDLGANSLLLARFCSAVRSELPAGAGLSIKDVYLHPTVRQLAAELDSRTPVVVDPAVAAPVTGGAAVASGQAAAGDQDVPDGRLRRGGSRILCGLAQTACFVGLLALGGSVLDGYTWVAAAVGPLATYLRAVALGAGTLAVTTALPIVAKWLLVGRWKPAAFPVYGLRYFRFWLVKTLIRANPMALFAGTPVFNWYLRALGARVGAGAVVLGKHVPVATDLVTIGAGAVVRRDTFLSAYRARAGMIEIGSVSIGANAFVGEATTMDIGTSLGEGAELGHASALQTGQHVPAGQSWHGSPARLTGTRYRSGIRAPGGTLRRVLFGLSQLASTVLVTLPLTIGAFALADRLVESTPMSLARMLSPAVLRAELLGSLAVFGGLTVGGLLLVTLVPRLMRPLLRPGVVYPLYGFRYSVLRTTIRLTNLPFFMEIFGDSSYVVGYLRALGYDLDRPVQTGSNFGMTVHHDTPFLSTVGRGTMASDGLAILNADYSDTALRVDRVTIGRNNYLGNALAYPAGARVGDDCLLATKAMVPIDGPVRTGVGLLGSPCFEIPRAVTRDRTFDHLATGEALRRNLRAKNRHNLVSIAGYLLTRWLQFFCTVVIAMVATALPVPAWLSAVVFGVGSLLFSMTYCILIERATMAFRPMVPRFCSLYQRPFWRHERYWKLGRSPYMRVFVGTPMKPVVWRLLGVRVGRWLFDDGSSMAEKSLVRLGDHVTLAEGSLIQCHSLEEGTFKSDRTSVGDGCTVGVSAFVHYGVDLADGSVVAADSFVMKGESVAAGELWQGNPAQPVAARRTVAPAVVPAVLPSAVAGPAIEPVVVRAPGQSDVDRVGTPDDYAREAIPMQRSVVREVVSGPAPDLAARGR